MSKNVCVTILVACSMAILGCNARAMIDRTVPSGTPLEVELMDSVSSADNVVGDAVSARLSQDVVVDGKTAIPAGSTLSGKITEVRGLKAIGGRALLRVEFDTVELPESEAPIRASFFRQGKSETKKDAATIGGATAGGALLGRLLDKNHEARGTMMGAVVGGAAGTAIAAGTKGEEIVLPSGTRLTLHLQGAATVKVEA